MECTASPITVMRGLLGHCGTPDGVEQVIFQKAASFSFISVKRGLKRGDHSADSDFAISAASFPMILKSLFGGLILMVLVMTWVPQRMLQSLTFQVEHP